eukprot:scaffold249380_cov63-Cyclotella_meneghiniana.AAC.1
MYEVEFLCWSEQAISTSLEVSHIHGNSMDINPKNTNPEQATDNKERRTHSYCNCNCEEKGLKRCHFQTASPTELNHRENRSSQSGLLKSTDFQTASPTELNHRENRSSQS